MLGETRRELGGWGHTETGESRRRSRTEHGCRPLSEPLPRRVVPDSHVKPAPFVLVYFFLTRHPCRLPPGGRRAEMQSFSPGGSVGMHQAMVWRDPPLGRSTFGPDWLISGLHNTYAPHAEKIDGIAPVGGGGQQLTYGTCKTCPSQLGWISLRTKHVCPPPVTTPVKTPGWCSPPPLPGSCRGGSGCHPGGGRGQALGRNQVTKQKNQIGSWFRSRNLFIEHINLSASNQLRLELAA